LTGRSDGVIQTYTADTITLDCNRNEFLIKGEDNLWEGRYLYELYQKATTPWEWQPRLRVLWVAKDPTNVRISI